ncbi:mitochondrial pyruvate carrier [Acrasis kona]|uniref:Mitochondrial pyruvate carrier n=1 Tax=Acrasis kona TaxID=1008807 RepID=A0AAW2ZS56_9EUKA
MSAFNRLWNHPAGPKTIFFWAPAMKWALVIASINDIRKPVEVVSTNQNLALAATGIIWSRYATQITPVNYSLLTVNIFVALTSLYQLYRKQQAGQLKFGK